MTDLDPREQVAEVAREVHERELTATYGGGVSMRDGDKVWVTATYYPLREGSLTCLGETTKEHIIAVDLETGDKISGDWNPSWETPAHLAIYKDDPTVNGVVHGHSIYATAFAIANIDLVCWPDSPRSHLGKVPVVPLVPCGSDWMAANIAEGLKDRVAVLLRSHGVWVKGQTLRMALHNLEQVEAAAKEQIFAALLRTGPMKETFRILQEEAKFMDNIHKEEKRIKHETFGIDYRYPDTK
jgi:L-fuculose-phosphate aldolase